MGSPNVVPVPGASPTSTSAVVKPALANAARITRCWEGPLRAVKPLEAPSWWTARPRTPPNTECPSRRAPDNRSSTRTPTPSPHAVPSAAPANDLHRPSTARPRCRLNPTKTAGEDSTVAPAANAKSDSPDRNDCTAQCMATNDDEHAVSTDPAGPSSPRKYAPRPEATLDAVPVSRYPS